jgi:hypothetical protein
MTAQNAPRQRIYYHDMENNDLIVIKNLITPARSGRAVDKYDYFLLEDGWLVDD